MKKHRNPRPRLSNHPAADNPPRRPRGTNAVESKREMSAVFDQLVRENPRVADAVLTALRIVASTSRRRAVQLVEALATVVAFGPTNAPGGPD